MAKKKSADVSEDKASEAASEQAQPEASADGGALEQSAPDEQVVAEAASEQPKDEEPKVGAEPQADTALVTTLGGPLPVVSAEAVPVVKEVLPYDVAPIQDVQISDIVIFRDDIGGDHPAIVTDVVGGEQVSLTVFWTLGTSVYTVPWAHYSDEPKARTWRWPPRVKAAMLAAAEAKAMALAEAEAKKAEAEAEAA